jgi:hypothetical protein
VADKEVSDRARAEAIAAFLKEQDLDAKLAEAVKFIATRRPSAILIFWEEDEGYGAITVPYSNAMSYGLANKAYESLVIDVDNAAVEARYERDDDDDE